jgi:23S rRNA pseudouridine1911/1915/1917 synthase
MAASDGDKRSVEVAAEQHGMRLDRVLTVALPDLSRSRLKTLIQSGQVALAGRSVIDVARKVRPGERYVVDIPPPVEAEPSAENIPLDIVYEDKDLIVINKPPGLVVHPAAGNPSGTLVNALLAHCGDSLQGIGGALRPGIVHRLDKDTSGLLVAAKTEKAHRSLGRQFAAHAITRVYTAIVWGAPRQKSGTIVGAIGRSQSDRKKMTIVTKGGKEARTHFEVLERFALGGETIASEIACRLETGRTHQIRVHMASTGHPLVGDSVYGRARRLPRAKTVEDLNAVEVLTTFPRQALHAGVLGFHHPTLDKTLRFERSPPADMENLMAKLRGITLK